MKTYVMVVENLEAPERYEVFDFASSLEEAVEMVGVRGASDYGRFHDKNGVAYRVAVLGRDFNGDFKPVAYLTVNALGGVKTAPAVA